MDIKEVIDQSELSRLQYATILICFLMTVLDGMDIMIISYAAPTIAREWGVSPEALGVLFSSGLLGMAFGALFIAPYADTIGRKKMIMLSAVIMGISIYLTAFAGSMLPLIAFRFISGLGIGCMLACTAALTAEYTPHQTKDFWVSFVMAGYPVGAVLSGLVAAEVIPRDGWQAMFQIAGFASLGAIPLIHFFLSESLEFYLKSQPHLALQKANRILASMQLNQLEKLPPKPTQRPGIPIQSLLENGYKRPTLQLWMALFLSFATLYFLISWIPKLTASTGLSVELAIYAGTIFHVGSFFGIITQGYFSSRVGLKKTIGFFLIVTGLLMAAFQLFIEADILLLLFGVLGFGISGGFVGLYTVAARVYPTEFRATGIGWSIGLGRLGAIIGPAAGGILIGMGLSMIANFLIYAVPTIFAGLTTMFISSKEVS